MKILCPVPTGSGAGVMHSELARSLEGYYTQDYSPWWELMPLAMPLLNIGRADLIHATLDYGLFFKRPRKPLILTAHSYFLDSAIRPYSSAIQNLHYRTDLRWFSIASLKLSHTVTAVSRFVADLLRDDLEYSKEIRVIYNGVDEKRFFPARKGSSHRPFRILFCGKTSKGKRADLLIPMANTLGQDFEIMYTQGLSGKRKIKGILKPGAAKLVPLGKIHHEHMPELYREIDALFMPSAREGFGLCVAEAMACAIPIVAANSSALPELVKNGKGGYLCPIDDVSSYTRAFHDLAENPAIAKNMGEYNRSRVEHNFTLQKMTHEYRLLFEEVLDTGEKHV